MGDLTLSDEIKAYFPDHDKFCVQNLLVVSWSIFEGKTTNLNKAKDYVAGILGNGLGVDESSNYARLIRFFKTENQAALVKSILTVCCLFLKPSRGRRGTQYLVLDGTEWAIGETKIQLLTLCILWHGVAIPIWWEDLEKLGHSSQEERKILIINALKQYDLRGMVLLADREYLGEDWFSFLRQQGIDFVIRLKSTVYHAQVNASKGLRQSAMLHQVQGQNRRQWVDKNITLKGFNYRYIVVKNRKQDPEEPLLYLLTSLDRADKAIGAYALRWKIESCFKHLKSNGFDLEAMNVKGSEKRQLMMAVVVFLYVLATTEGYLAIQKTKNDKKHYKYFHDKQVQTLAISFFRKGISVLHRKIDNFKELLTWLTEILKELIMPNWCHV